MQIASTTNASPLAVAPAMPGANGLTGEDSPFGKILSAQKQPAAKLGDAQSTRSDSKPEAKVESASKGNEPAKTEVPETDASQAPAAARRGTARNAPRLSAHGRDAAKPQAHANPVEGNARGKDSAKDVDKKDTDPNAAASMNLPPAMPAAMPPALPQTAGDSASATAMPGAGALPLSTSTATALPADEAVQSTATAARGAQDAARVDADDAKRDLKFADAAASVAEASELARRVSGDEQLIGRKDSQERVEQRLEVPSLSELASTSHVAAAHSAPQVESAAPPVSVTVVTPATSPEFNEALGVQVGVLARDGVQHAELHVNPADMGPISVQIALDGTRAQVDFGADSLATRQIIESGLPELASALRDAGFTLAGGGVSQHSRGQADRKGGELQPGASSSRRVNGSNDVQSAPTRRSTVRMSQGGVDLYA
jgi:flagellar hook-length control protein FliK